LGYATMAPVKFDDLQKVASGVVNDDFQTSGYVLKAKQKTQWSGAVLSHQVDLFDKTCATPAKVTWKIPKPFEFDQVSVDKLEIDKAGKSKVELSFDKLHPKLKVECKGSFEDPCKAVVGCQYTGVPDAQVKFETKACQPLDFNGEVTYNKKQVTGGVKFNKSVLKGGLPDFGLRFTSGPLFLALVAKDKLDNLNAAASYKVCPDMQCAATYSFAQKAKKGNLALAASYKGLYKLKLTQDQTVAVSAKHNVAKGFSLLGGAKFNAKSKDFSYGLQVSVE